MQRQHEKTQTNATTSCARMRDRDRDTERRRRREREKRNNTQVERKPGQACVAGSNGPYLSVSQLERSRSPKDPLKTDPDLLFYLHTLSNPPWCVPTLRAYWPIGKFQSSSWTIYVPTDPSFWGAAGRWGGGVKFQSAIFTHLPSSLSLFKWSKVTTK